MGSSQKTPMDSLRPGASTNLLAVNITLTSHHRQAADGYSPSVGAKHKRRAFCLNQPSPRYVLCVCEFGRCVVCPENSLIIIFTILNVFIIEMSATEENHRETAGKQSGMNGRKAGQGARHLVA